MITHVTRYVGGRLISSYPVAYVYRFVRSLPLRSVMLVTGGASGVDQAAERMAKSLGMATATIPYFKEEGKRGGFSRNEVLVDFVHYLVAFWDGKSHGTKHAIDLAKAQGKLRAVYGPAGLEIEI